MKKKLQNKKGFTLVELIVVIAIIAILAALAVPRVEDFVDDARQAQRKADFRTMYTGVTAGYTDWIAADAGNALTGTTAIDISGSTGLKASIDKRIPAGHSIVATTVDGTSTKDTDTKTWSVTYKMTADGSVEEVTIINSNYISVNGEEPKKQS